MAQYYPPPEYPYAEEESHFDQTVDDADSFSYYEDDPPYQGYGPGGGARGPPGQGYNYQPDDRRSFARGPTRGPSMMMGPQTSPPPRRMRPARTMVRYGSGIPPQMMGYEPDYPIPPEMLMDPYAQGGVVMNGAPSYEQQQQSLYLAQMKELERCQQRKAFMPKKPSEDEAVFVAMLCSEQDALYGTNMLEDITPDDRMYIDSLIARGVPENEALRLSFERKPHPYKVKSKPDVPDTPADIDALEQAIQASLTESSIRASQPDGYSVAAPGLEQEIDVSQLEDVPRPSAQADEDALQAAIRLSMMEGSRGVVHHPGTQSYALRDSTPTGTSNAGAVARAHSYGEGDEARDHYQLVDNNIHPPLPAPPAAGGVVAPMPPAPVHQNSREFPSEYPRQHSGENRRPSAIQMEISQRKALHASYAEQMQHQNQQHHQQRQESHHQHQHHSHHHQEEHYRQSLHQHHRDSRTGGSDNDIRGAIDAEMRNRPQPPVPAPPAPPAYHTDSSQSPPPYTQANYGIQLSHQQLHTKSNPLKKSHSLVGRSMEGPAAAATALNARTGGADEGNEERSMDRHESDPSMASSITHESAQQQQPTREISFTRPSDPPAYRSRAGNIDNAQDNRNVPRQQEGSRPPLMNGSNSGSGRSPFGGIAHSNSVGSNLSDHNSSSGNLHHARSKYHVRGSLVEEPEPVKKDLPRYQSNSHLLELMESLKDDDDDEPAMPVRTDSAMNKLLSMSDED